MPISQRQNHLSSLSNRIKQTAPTNRVWVKATINRGHILGPMKILTLMIREDKMQLPKQRAWDKTTINREHTLGPFKNTYPCDPTRKMQSPKQTEFGLKQPLTEDTPSDLAKSCEHQPLLHRLTNKTIKNTHTRGKNKNKEDKQTQGTNY